MNNALKIKSTNIIETDAGFTVDLHLFDGETPESSENTISIHWTLQTPERGPRLVVLQKVVLEHVQSAIGDEIGRLLRHAESTR